MFRSIFLNYHQRLPKLFIFFLGGRVIKYWYFYSFTFGCYIFYHNSTTIYYKVKLFLWRFHPPFHLHPKLTLGGQCRVLSSHLSVSSYQLFKMYLLHCKDCLCLDDDDDDNRSISTFQAKNLNYSKRIHRHRVQLQLISLRDDVSPRTDRHRIRSEAFLWRH